MCILVIQLTVYRVILATNNLKHFSNISRLRRLILASFAFSIVQTLILVLGLQCSTRLATCNFSENELIATFARVSTSLKLPVYSRAVK